MNPQPALDVQAQYLQIGRDILQKYVPDRTVWAFGSRVTGKSKKYFDVDLALLGDLPLGIALSATIEEAFSESDLPWKVDVVDWAVASAQFRTIIEQEKIIVQGRALP